MQTYQGRCHCGAVKFEFSTNLTEFTKCDCSLCVKKNAVMTKINKSDFTLLQGEDQLGLYQWNKNIARHRFCKNCGIYTFHQKRADPNTMGINVYCIEGVDISDIPIINVDGKTMSGGLDE